MKGVKLEVILTNATINAEKAGGEEGEVGSALRFDGDVLADKLVGLFSSPESFNAVIGSLYGNRQDLVTSDVSAIKLSLELEKVRASIGGPILEDERLVFTGCRLNSVALAPKHGRAVGVTLKLYVHPSEEQWAQIVALVRRGVVLTLSGGAAAAEKDDAQKGLALDAPGEPTPATPPVH